MLGQKADLGLMLLGPDLGALDAFTVELSASPLGAALLPAASYVSLTELSEYTSTSEDEAARLVAQEHLTPGSPEHAEALAAFDERMAAYREHRLHPRLPLRGVLLSCTASHDSDCARTRKFRSSGSVCTEAMVKSAAGSG